MKKRFKLSKGHSKRMFSHHADMTHRRNMSAPNRMPMRGGIRL